MLVLVVSLPMPHVECRPGLFTVHLYSRVALPIHTYQVELFAYFQQLVRATRMQMIAGCLRMRRLC